MCQIIYLREKEKNSLIKFLLNEKERLKNSLNFKGGEGYSFFLYERINSSKKYRFTKISSLNFEDGFQDILKKLINNTGPKVTSRRLVLFSRQRPEIEKENVPLPPYFNEDETKAVWMHGTIQNVEELEKKYGFKVDVDTEVLIQGIDRNEIKGNYSALVALLDRNDFLIYDNGLGWYAFEKEKVEIITTDPGFYDNDLHLNESDPEVDTLIVSYSGGMDVAVSTMYEIKKRIKNGNPFKNIYLVYFDYGARARKQEIEASRKMIEKLKYIYKAFDIDAVIELEIINIKPMMQNIAAIFNKEIKLIDKNAEADSREAESTLAYIPMRNTIFIELLGAFAEGRNITRANFLLGLNLSEGMVYLDNSEAWLLEINELIKRCGKEYYPHWRVFAPFYNKTKINMLKEFKKEFGDHNLKEVLDIAFSCYYPRKDGSPCGKCGSCLLRQKAEEIIKEDNVDYLKTQIKNLRAKIKIDNEEDLLDFQTKYFKYGGSWILGDQKIMHSSKFPFFLFAENGKLTWSDDYEYFKKHRLKEITLKEFNELLSNSNKKERI
jgi:7-cyano-7-deazaguanine synthase in queuosine biosynthesis